MKSSDIPNKTVLLHFKENKYLPGSDRVVMIRIHPFLFGYQFLIDFPLFSLLYLTGEEKAIFFWHSKSAHAFTWALGERFHYSTLFRITGIDLRTPVNPAETAKTNNVRRMIVSGR